MEFKNNIYFRERTRKILKREIKHISYSIIM